MSDRGYVTTANARIEYHRNGVGGEGYYTIAFDSQDADPPILEVGQRMMAIVPAKCTHDEDGWLLPIKGTHIPELLVIDPAHVMPFVTGEGHMGNWRGADYDSQLVIDPAHVMPFAEATPDSVGAGYMGNWRGADYFSQLVMTILHDDRRAKPYNSSEYEVGGRFFGVLPPLPMPEEKMAEALGAYGY